MTCNIFFYKLTNRSAHSLTLRYPGQRTVWLYAILDNTQFDFMLSRTAHSLTLRYLGQRTVWLYNIPDSAQFDFTLSRTAHSLTLPYPGQHTVWLSPINLYFTWQQLPAGWKVTTLFCESDAIRKKNEHKLSLNFGTELSQLRTHKSHMALTRVRLSHDITHHALCQRSFNQKYPSLHDTGDCQK